MKFIVDVEIGGRYVSTEEYKNTAFNKNGNVQSIIKDVVARLNSKIKTNDINNYIIVENS